MPKKLRNKRKQADTHAVAIAALAARITELSVRLSHAKLAKDGDKIESVTKKLAIAMSDHAQLQRKHKRKHK